MSLLIKALEQAAKDRKAGRVEPAENAPAAATQPAGPIEPTLEPAPPPRGGAAARTPSRAGPSERPAPAPAAAPGPARAGTSAAAAAATPSYAAADTPAAPRRAPTSLSGLAQVDAQQQRARAATVMQAGGGPAANVIAFFRGSPVMMLAAVAVLFGVVFGAYVYLQIAKPGMFVRQAATRPQDAAPPAPPTPPPAPSGLPESAAPGGAPLAGAPAEMVPAPPTPVMQPAPTAGTIAPPTAVAPGGPGPLSSSSVIAKTPPQDLQRAPAERAPEARAERSPTRAERQAEARAAAAAATPAAAAAPGGERISVSASGTQPRLNPMLTQAYSQLQSGNVDEARTLYTRINQAEPLNIDALLGLAYVATQENRSEDAMRHYLRILNLNPRHAVAQGAMIGLMGRADPAASESRLKQLLAREPSPFLHFVLGNLYADQSQWTQAQQSYFQAHHLEPENPDYAYNLAVGLDHLRQPKPALNFYRRAEQLASTQGRSNFNLSHARERIRALSSQLE